MIRLTSRYFSSKPRRSAPGGFKVKDEVHKFVENIQSAQPSDWNALRENLKKVIANEIQLDNHILASLHSLESDTKSFNLTKQFIESIKERRGELSIVNYDHLIQSYLRKESLTADEQAELCNACETVVKQSDFILPIKNFSSVVRGICRTPQWKKSIDYLSSSVHVKQNMSLYIADRAFAEGDFDLGFELMEKVGQLPEIPRDFWNSYWLSCKRNATNCFENIERMLSFIGLHDLYLPESTIGQLLKTFGAFGLSGYKTKITSDGVCSQCQNILEHASLDDDDFERLKRKLIENAIYGRNIKFQTSEEEFQKFNTFLEKHVPFDYVVDGLNISFANATSNPDLVKTPRVKNLETAVMHFAQQNKKVLVIGRHHMHRWNQNCMKIIKRNSVFYTVNNDTHDDLYTLYAALVSGPKTKIVSNDYMRSHSCLLGPELRKVFRQWQNQNQCFFEKFKMIPNPEFKLIPAKKYNRSCHCVKNCWHLPFLTDEEYDLGMLFLTKLLNENYACIKFDKNNKNRQ